MVKTQPKSTIQYTVNEIFLFENQYLLNVVGKGVMQIYRSPIFKYKQIFENNYLI